MREKSPPASRRRAFFHGSAAAGRASPSLDREPSPT
ncbi:Uncharacterised protein [Bordetella pertussis]|nr:Uncharacterised protein [Bordetella pertussis]